MLVSLGKADFGETATQYRHLLPGTRLALLRNTATFSSLCRKPERSWVKLLWFFVPPPALLRAWSTAQPFPRAELRRGCLKTP